MMKNKILIFMLLITGVLFLTAQSNNLMAQTTQEKASMKKTVKYTCPHHPKIVSDKPGTCSECGMDLVAMKDKDPKEKSSDMKKDDMKMKGGAKKMEKGPMMHDSKDMKHDHMKMKKDSTKMMKEKM
jgi:hypothetical protein